MSAEEREAIRALAQDIPGLWRAPSTTSAERQTILRQLVEEVRVTCVGETERVEVSVQWVGGHRTRTEVVRPVARLEQLSNWPRLLARLEALHREGLTSREAAEKLNAEGWRPPKRRPTFTGDMVRSILSRHGLTRHQGRRQRRGASALRAHEWRLTDLAAKLAMPSITLYSWMKRGWVKGRQLEEPCRPWVIRADTKKLARLAALRTAPKYHWPRERSPRTPA